MLLKNQSTFLYRVCRALRCGILFCLFVLLPAVSWAKLFITPVNEQDIDLDLLLLNQRYGEVVQHLQKINPVTLAPQEAGDYWYSLLVSYAGLKEPDLAYPLAQLLISKRATLDLSDLEWLRVFHVYSHGLYRTQQSSNFLASITQTDLKNWEKADPTLADETAHKIFLIFAQNEQYDRIWDLFYDFGAFSGLFFSQFAEKMLFVRQISFLDEILPFTLNAKLRETLLLRKIQIYLEQGNIDEANDTIQKFAQVAQAQNNPFLNQLIAHRNRIVAGKPLSIGLILPLYDAQLIPLSDQILHGVRQGLLDFFPDTFEWELHIANQTAPDEIAQPYEYLVKDKNVSVVLGPITKLTTEKLAATALLYGVPFVSYSLSANIQASNPYAYVFQRNASLELLYAAKYSVDVLCAKNQVILFSPSQEKQANLYEQQVISQGAQVLLKQKINHQSVFASVFNQWTGESYYQGESLQDVTKDATSLEQQADATAPQLPDLVFGLLSFKQFLLSEKFGLLYKLDQTKYLGLSFLHKAQLLLERDEAEDRVWFVDNAEYQGGINSFSDRLSHSFYLLKHLDERSVYSIYSYLSIFLIAQAASFSEPISSSGIARSFYQPSTQSTPFGQILRLDNAGLSVAPLLFSVDMNGFVIEPQTASCQESQIPSTLD